MGFHIDNMRVGNDNLFQSEVFSKTIANLVGCAITVVETTGAAGAAKAAGLKTGFYTTLKEAIGASGEVMTYEPATSEEHEQAYQVWRSDLEKLIGTQNTGQDVAVS